MNIPIYSNDTTMPSLPKKTIQVIESIEKIGISPILYGSQGVSLYIGQYKQFGDIDLLVDTKWIDKRWQALVAKMGEIGFELIDEHEHEFSDHHGTTVAFADSQILIRDKIAASVRDATQTIEVNNTKIRTLKPKAFLEAYEFSALDGYRKEIRNKKDGTVISLLKDYLSQAQNL